MPLFSAFNPFGMLKFSGAPSRAENIYRSMYAAKIDAFDLTVGGYQEAKVYAQSMGLARGRYALERAQNQRNPYKAVELLPALEKNWAVVPSETDTLLDRQVNVATKMILVRGARREAVEEGLSAILGSHFIAMRTLTTTEVVSEQSTTVNFARHDLPFKVVQLTTPVASTGSQTVGYANADPTAGDILLLVGDILTVQPEHYGLHEVVTVTAATATTFTATFVHAHDINSFATTQNWVDWISTQRAVLIVVDSATALDAQTVRRVDDFMSRVSRGITVWDIVQPTTPGADTIGPFTLNTSPLGAVPVGEISIIPPITPDFRPFPPSKTTSEASIHLFGRNLFFATSVIIDGTEALSSVLSDGDLLLGFDCYSVAGVYSVTVITPTSTVVLPAALTITQAPLTITSLSTDEAADTGGDEVTINGTGMLSVTDVKIDGVSVTTWAPNRDIDLVFYTDPMSAGFFTLEITDGVNTVSTAFHVFTTQPLTVSSLTPNNGTELGGTDVVAAGTGLTAVVDIQIDGVSIIYTDWTIDNDNQITFTTQGGLGTGTFDVTFISDTDSTTISFTYT